MSRRVALLLAVNAIGLLAVGFLVGRLTEDDDSADRTESGREADVTGEKEVGDRFQVGDLVEIITPGGCAALATIEGSQSRPLSVPCVGEGSVLEIAGGPRDEDTGRAWLLSGFGWVGEDMLAAVEGDPRQGIATGQLISFLDDEKDLYVMRANGTEKRLIAEGPVESHSWSPDGQRIAFGTHDEQAIENQRLVVVNLQGDVQVEVPGINSFTPLGWSPDGTMLAVDALSDDGTVSYGLAVVRLADGEIVFELADAQFASWSADSRRLAFRRFDTTELEGIDFPGVGAYVDLADGEVLDLAPGGPTYADHLFGLPLFRPGRPDEIAYAGSLINIATGDRLPLPDPVVKWSPDGRLAILALSRERLFGGHHYSLYEIDAPSDDERFQLYVSLPSCQCDAPSWAFVSDMLFSPDGRYFLATNNDFFFGERQLVVLELGQEWPQLPTFGAIHEFSNDGAYVLESSGYLVETEPGWIFVLSVEEARILVIGEGYLPQWQPTSN